MSMSSNSFQVKWFVSDFIAQGHSQIASSFAWTDNRQLDCTLSLMNIPLLHGAPAILHAKAVDMSKY